MILNLASFGSLNPRKYRTSLLSNLIVNPYLHSLNTKDFDLKQLYWIKEAFSLNYTFFEEGKVVGQIKDKSWNRTSTATLFGTKYVFEKEGVFNPHLNIIDLTDRCQIGRVDFTMFRSRARIRLGSQQYLWLKHGFMGMRWSVEDRNHRPHISGKSRKEGYCVLVNNETPVLLLTSLLIRNHFFKQGR